MNLVNYKHFAKGFSLIFTIPYSAYDLTFTCMPVCASMSSCHTTDYAYGESYGPLL